MKRVMQRIWQETDGVLSFEWTVLASLLTVGVVSGLSAVRDATIDEMGDLSLAMLSLDQSYYVQPPLVKVVAFGCGNSLRPTSATGSYFVDHYQYAECQRLPMPVAGTMQSKVVEHDWDLDGTLPDTQPQAAPVQPATPANPATPVPPATVP